MWGCCIKTCPEPHIRGTRVRTLRKLTILTISWHSFAFGDDCVRESLTLVALWLVVGPASFCFAWLFLHAVQARMKELTALLCELVEDYK